MWHVTDCSVCVVRKMAQHTHVHRNDAKYCGVMDPNLFGSAFAVLIYYFFWGEAVHIKHGCVPPLFLHQAMALQVQLFPFKV